MDNEGRSDGHGKYETLWGSYEGSWVGGKAHGFGVQIIKVKDRTVNGKTNIRAPGGTIRI